MSTTGRDVRQGSRLGLIAYVAVAAFYAVFDILAARGALFTVNMLGQSVFNGLRDPSVLQGPVALDGQAIFWYNAIHLMASLVIGVIVMRFIGIAEQSPSLLWPICAVLAAGYAVTILAVGWLTPHIRHVLPWWSIGAANAAAVVAGGMYVLRQRPGLFGGPTPGQLRGVA